MLLWSALQWWEGEKCYIYVHYSRVWTQFIAKFIYKYIYVYICIYSIQQSRDRRWSTGLGGSVSRHSSRAEFRGRRTDERQWIIGQTQANWCSGSLSQCWCHCWCCSSPGCRLRGPSGYCGQALGKDAHWNYCSEWSSADSGLTGYRQMRLKRRAMKMTGRGNKATTMSKWAMVEAHVG